MKMHQLMDERLVLALAKLLAHPVPLKTAFKLKDMWAKIQTERSRFEDLRNGALEQYGTREENGRLSTDDAGTVRFTPEGLQAFISEMNKWGDLEVDVGSISIDELEGIILSTNDVIAMDTLLRS